jgi:hypothetical protein
MAEEKLSSDQKECIKIRLQNGEYAKYLSKEYGVSLALIYRIWRPKKYPRYNGKRENIGFCRFCGKILKGKLPSAKVCDDACKQNYKRLGKKNKEVRFKNKTLLLSKEHWTGTKFGFLSIIDTPDLPKSWRRYSNIKVTAQCDCGKITTPTFCDLSRGTTQSCGFCRTQTSRESNDLFATVASIFPDAQKSVRGVLVEHPLMEFDIWIPSRKMAVEYHGLLWHSSFVPSGINKDRDFRKFLYCQEKGIRLLQIYSDDWKQRRPLFVCLLNRLANTAYGKRVYKTKAVEITHKEAQTFLNDNHYLSGSAVRGSLYAGLRTRKNELVSVSVFRQTPTGWDWTRHAVKCGIRLWNAAEKSLNFALSLLGNVVITTFSDNRVHTGNMYEKLGFEHRGFVRQSYEYTNGRIRRHKFAFRVPAGENEEQIAAAKGWYRIYDSGKNRWVLNPS